MAFWIATGTLCVIVLAAALMVLLRRRAPDISVADYDLRIYRDQLKEVDRDVARGVVSQEDAERARNEIKRRILEADKAAQSGAAIHSAPVLTTAVMAGLATVVIVGGAYLTYARIGAPGYPDLPMTERLRLAEEARDSRPSQATAEASLPAAPTRPDLDQGYLDLVAQLRETVEQRPDDLRGHILLFQHEANIGDFRAAYAAQERIIAIKGDEATAQDYANLADMMILAAGGYVSPEAETELSKALARDPRNGVARYYSGLMFSQTGRPDIAFRFWSELLAESSAEAPWQDPIRAQISDIALRAGVNDYVPPERGAAPMAPMIPMAPGLPGPDQDQIDAAGAMTPAERVEMIQGMVAGLAERLATEGGPPEEWARLIRAYGVLGQRDKAAAIWAEAQTVFPDDVTRVPILQAARDAGVAQ